MARFLLVACVLPALAWADPVAVNVAGERFEVAVLATGAKAFRNRDYLWQRVPQPLVGWQFTRADGGSNPILAATPEQDGHVYLAAAVRQNFRGNLAGWELVKDWKFRYSAPGRSLMRVFRTAAKAGQPLAIPQGGWTGALLLAPRITVAEKEPPPSTPFPGVAIDHRPASSNVYIGCPALAVLAPGAYVASHSFFGPGKENGQTLVFASNDAGTSWQRLAEIPRLSFASLFVHREALHLMGVSGGKVVMLRSPDGGATWTEPKDEATGLLLADGACHSAPVPVVEHNGRLWRAMEDRGAPGKWPRQFRTFMMSAPADADLLAASSWTASERLASNPKWLDEEFEGWLEGNAAVTPDGQIVNILRVDCWEGGKAAVVRVGATGKACRFDPRIDLIDFPGGAKKFTIRRDPVGGEYWSLTNWIDETTRQGRAAGFVRNNLALVSSPDLRQWRIRRLVLSHPDPTRHGFQYVDWQFDGEDIVAVSRTAFDDPHGGARNYHDANYFTFHRVAGFRNSEATE